jgi:hypothetical protein
VAVHRAWPLLALLVVGSFMTVAAAFFSNGSIVAALAPLVLAALLAVTWVAPLRLPLLGIVFLSLAIDAGGEGPWESPLAPLGRLLAINVNKSVPIQALALPGATIILLILLAIHVHRSLSHVHTDRRERAASADVLPLILLLSFATVVWVCFRGISAGGDVQMAKIQVQSFVMMLLVAYLTVAALRGTRDYRTLAAIVVFSAVVKSLMALYVVRTVAPQPPAVELNFAVTHGESLLFASAVVLLLVRLAEAPSARNLVSAAAIVPVILVGMSSNHRRLVYVEVAAALLLYWVVGRRSQVKRLVARAVLVCLPIIAAYVGAGWNSHSSVFAPVRIFRSVTDSDLDHSTEYRDLENYNLLATVRYNPLLGPGFGQPFAEEVKLPDISFFKEYRYMPHNSILGLWAFCGPLGFTGLMLTLVVGMYLAAIAYRAAVTPADRIAAFMCLSTIVIFLIHCWGDIGFTERKAIYLVGPALGAAAQLAVTTGAWPTRRRHT